MRGLGALHSRYAVRYAHVIFNTAKIAADLAHVKRDLRIDQSKFRVRHREEKKNIVDALMENDDELLLYQERIVELETKLKLLESVAAGYESLRNAASREMTRRLGERAATD